MTILSKVLLPVLVLLALPADSSAADPPLIVAHRGLLRHAPENTLANFRACLELRIGFEFDVQRTKDGYLVGIDAILTDYPLILRRSLKQTATNHGASP